MHGWNHGKKNLLIKARSQWDRIDDRIEHIPKWHFHGKIKFRIFFGKFKTLVRFSRRSLSLNGKVNVELSEIFWNCVKIDIEHCLLGNLWNCLLMLNVYNAGQWIDDMSFALMLMWNYFCCWGKLHLAIRFN